MRRAPWPRALELALAVLGVVLLGLAAESKIRAGRYQSEQRRAFAEKSKTSSGDRDATPPAASASSLAGDALARIDIPRVGVSAMVREGADDATLAIAVGHIPGTALPGEVGNMGLAGHRDSFFRGLRQIALDDTIEVRAPHRVDRYRVEAIGVVGPKELSVLAPTQEMTLTLVTCYPFTWIGHAPNRFVVRARRVDASADALGTRG